MKRRLCLGCRLFSGDVSEKEGEVCEQLGVEKRVVVSISVVPVVSRVGPTITDHLTGLSRNLHVAVS